MATLTVGSVARTGLKLTGVAAAAAGDKFANTGQEALWIENTGGAARTLTIVTQQTIDGLAVADRTMTVSGSSEYLVGPWPKGAYQDADGFVSVTYSTHSNLVVQAVKLVKV